MDSRAYAIQTITNATKIPKATISSAIKAKYAINITRHEAATRRHITMLTARMEPKIAVPIRPIEV